MTESLLVFVLIGACAAIAYGAAVGTADKMEETVATQKAAIPAMGHPADVCAVCRCRLRGQRTPMGCPGIRRGGAAGVRGLPVVRHGFRAAGLVRVP